MHTWGILSMHTWGILSMHTWGIPSMHTWGIPSMHTWGMHTPTKMLVIIMGKGMQIDGGGGEGGGECTT